MTALISIGIILVYSVAMLVAGAARWLSLAMFAAVPLTYFFALLLLKTNPRTEDAAQDLS